LLQLLHDTHAYYSSRLVVLQAVDFFVFLFKHSVGAQTADTVHTILSLGIPVVYVTMK